MSKIIEVCCNGASAGGHKQALRLEYRPQSRNRNVRLGLPRFVENVYHIPNRTLDLLELAAYIYAADRNTRRGRRDAVEYHSWSRRFRIRMRVRDLDFWSRGDVQAELNTCLSFMTGDSAFEFVFASGHSTPPTSLFDQAEVVQAQAGNHEVALFSGGLDSLGGAVETLTGTDSRLLLVGHHSQAGTKQVQRQIVRAINTRFGDRTTLYGFECTLSHVRAAEETQRSRSFLYCSIGFAVAQAHHVAALSIYENGVTSLNLTRREDLANARASRTTHPRALKSMERVLSLVGDSPFRIKTPGFWRTKSEIIESIVQQGQGDLIASSVSCSRTFQREGSATQCGRCFQCIDRRLAIFAAGYDRLDPRDLYTVDFISHSIPESESRTTAVDYLRQAARFAESNVDAFESEYVSELADAIDDIPVDGSDSDKIGLVWELMKRHGIAVRRGLLNMRERYDDPLLSLKEGSLLSLVASREHLRPAPVRLAESIVKVVGTALGTMFRVQKPANENDLNAKLASLIHSNHKLVSEFPTVPFACARVVPDHTLDEAALLVECKYIRRTTTPSVASEGIAADLVKFPRNAHILFLVYDPERRIPSDQLFKQDFELTGRCTVEVLR